MLQTAAQPQTGTHSPVVQVAETIEVHREELPLCCPRPQDSLWNMHPRVYLSIDQEPDGIAVCPYCGARYRLVD